MYVGNLEELKQVVTGLERIRDGEFLDDLPDDAETIVRPTDIAQIVLRGKLARGHIGADEEELAKHLAKFLRGLGWERKAGIWKRPADPSEVTK